ncbi:MAG: IMPACT family protein [Balneolaceae bacterium]
MTQSNQGVRFHTFRRTASAKRQVKGSEFIGLTRSVSSREAAENELECVRKEHPKATHHCYAWRLNPHDLIEFSQDDGEPGGTAGLPILHALQANRLVNVLLVVVRYYGGTKLGKPGLIQAYGEAATAAIQSTPLEAVHLVEKVTFCYDYGLQPAVEKLRATASLIELEAAYGERVEITFGCPENAIVHLDRFCEQTGYQLHNIKRHGLTAITDSTI